METYQAEAREKWGNTKAYREYTEKTKNYSKDHFQSMAEGLNALFGEFAACKQAGETSDSAPAQILVKKLQGYITGNDYTCTREILAGLGQMYVLDERFQSNIDQNGKGTAAFVSAAIETYCGT